jgi:hypothetical protein
MIDIARIKMIEAVSRAVETKREHDVRNAESLLRSVCYRQKKSWLMFIFDDVLPAMDGVIKGVPNLSEIECQYCKKQVKNITGLKAHLGVKHQDKKNEWSGKF